MSTGNATSDMIDSLAAAAFGACWTTRPLPDGVSLPAWELQSDGTQACWRACAEAVLEASGAAERDAELATLRHRAASLIGELDGARRELTEADHLAREQHAALQAMSEALTKAQSERDALRVLLESVDRGGP